MRVLLTVFVFAVLACVAHGYCPVIGGVTTYPTTAQLVGSYINGMATSEMSEVIGSCSVCGSGYSTIKFAASTGDQYYCYLPSSGHLSGLSVGLSSMSGTASCGNGVGSNKVWIYWTFPGATPFMWFQN